MDRDIIYGSYEEAIEGLGGDMEPTTPERAAVALSKLVGDVANAIVNRSAVDYTGSLLALGAFTTLAMEDQLLTLETPARGDEACRNQLNEWAANGDGEGLLDRLAEEYAVSV